MERLRKKYICQKQIKKGRSGTRELLKYFKKNYSIAMMIDQRVSEGIKVNFFGQTALTSTIAAQLVKKYGCKIVPIHIERINSINFKIKINEPINYSKESSIEEITQDLNKWLEKMILLKSSILILTLVAIKSVPAFPGKQYNFLTFFDSNIFVQMACSLPPLPITPIITYN